MTQFIRCPHCGNIAATIDYAKSKASLELEAAQPIDKKHFSTRTVRVLTMDGVKTLGDLCQVTGREILQKPNAGRKTLNEIKDVLARFGMALKTNEPDVGGTNG
jgi:DNA-directed RNA polymerase alpha subunit